MDIVMNKNYIIAIFFLSMDGVKFPTAMDTDILSHPVAVAI